MNEGVNIRKYAGNPVGKEQPDWLQGKGEYWDVYLVPIDKLYYNDDNGRIATSISSYSDAAGNMNLHELSLQEYNDRIHDFIKQSNTPESFKKTLRDIQLKGQIRPGVILSDGRVVSGNRRFTMLRELHKESGSDMYFKCFIIDKNLDNEDDRKYIKTIERLTQFGVDEKVGYDPISRLVDIYNDLIGPNKIWSIDEYSKKLSMKKSVVQQMVNRAKLMVDYLAYRNKPNKFYIARMEKLDGPINELEKLYANTSSTAEWNRIRPVFYQLFSESGDTTREVRKLKRMYYDDIRSFDEILSRLNKDIEDSEFMNLEKDSQYKPLVEEVNQTVDTNSPDKVEVPKISDDTKELIFFKINEVKQNKERQKKLDGIFKSVSYIITNSLDVYEIMNDEERCELLAKLVEIENIINHLKDMKNENTGN